MSALVRQFAPSLLPPTPGVDVAPIAEAESNSQVAEQVPQPVGADVDTPYLSAAGAATGFSTAQMCPSWDGQQDREAAEEELADRFEIVPDDYAGDRRPDQITQAELEEVAAMYSDIRLGHSDIAFDATGSGMSDEDFQAAVMGDIGTILTTAQGRALIRELAYVDEDHKGHKTTIGYAAGGPASADTEVDVSVVDHAYDGQGADARILYQPGVDVDLNEVAPGQFEQDAWAKMTSDIVLFHEACHAVHAHQGTRELSPSGGIPKVQYEDRLPLTPDDRGVQREEWRAVGIGPFADEPYSENAYREERSVVTGTDIPERDSYRGFGPEVVQKKPPG